jgi:hypothetical protein
MSKSTREAIRKMTNQIGLRPEDLAPYLERAVQQRMDSFTNKRGRGGNRHRSAGAGDIQTAAALRHLAIEAMVTACSATPARSGFLSPSRHESP